MTKIQPVINEPHNLPAPAGTSPHHAGHTRAATRDHRQEGSIMTTMASTAIMTGAPIEIGTSICVPEGTPDIEKIFTNALAGALNVHSFDFGGDRTIIRGTVANIRTLQDVELPMMTITALG